MSYQTVRLRSGSHYPHSGEACAMEVVSMLARERFSDHPRCACPVLAEYVRELNDWLSESEREWLWPYTARLVGSRDHSREAYRTLSIVEWSGFVVGRCRSAERRWVTAWHYWRRHEQARRAGAIHGRMLAAGERATRFNRQGRRRRVRAEGRKLAVGAVGLLAALAETEGRAAAVAEALLLLESLIGDDETLTEEGGAFSAAPSAQADRSAKKPIFA